MRSIVVTTDGVLFYSTMPCGWWFEGKNAGLVGPHPS